MSNKPETPEQKIKHLEHELQGANDLNYLHCEMLRQVDRDSGTDYVTRICRIARVFQAKGRLSSAKSCRLHGIGRQAVYQRLSRHQRQRDLQPATEWVLDLLRKMPRLGTRIAEVSETVLFRNNNQSIQRRFARIASIYVMIGHPLN